MAKSLTQLGILGESPIMQRLNQWVQKAAPQWDTILITGERGTGKELLAHAIHKLGPTRGGTSALVDCAALHVATAESVLFGHERGSFTGAVNKHVGLLERAHEGTLFLDEIGTLSLELQSRFLRFLEERTVQPIGSHIPRKIRTRIIAATNRDLEQDVLQGAFLPDLLDRLNVLNVELPPLRERGEDRWLLIRHFLNEPDLKRFTSGAVDAIMNYDFPGNIRELRNFCRRLKIFHLDSRVTEADAIQHLGRTLLQECDPEV